MRTHRIDVNGKSPFHKYGKPECSLRQKKQLQKRWNEISSGPLTLRDFMNDLVLLDRSVV